MNYADYIKKYCDDLIALRGTLSPARNQHIITALNYFHNLNPDLDWGKMDTNEAKTVYAKLMQSGLKESTLALRSRYILGFLKYLCEEKLNTNMDYTVICKMKAHKNPPPVIDEQEILTEKQLKELLSHDIPDRMKLIIACLFGGGMRISEVLNLRAGDVTYKYDSEFERPYIRISVDDKKTQKRRTTFVIIPYLMDIIKNHKVTSGYYLTGTDKKVTYAYVRYWMDKEKKHFPKLSSHKGRKFNISHRIANGESAATVCLTTHGNPHSSSINHYLRLNEKDAIRGMMRND